MTNQEIKRASLVESKIVWHIIDTCARHLAAQGSPDWSQYYTPDLVDHKITDSYTYIYYRDNLPVATLTLDTKVVSYYSAQDLQKFKNPSAPALYVSALAVLPDYQSQGIATNLLSFAESEAASSSAKYLRFDCNGRLLKLVRFYLNRGYLIRGFESGEDYFLMEKEITRPV